MPTNYPDLVPITVSQAMGYGGSRAGEPPRPRRGD